MTVDNRKLLRVAVKIHDCLSQQCPLPPTIGSLDNSCLQFQRLKRQIQRAGERKWHLASQKLFQELVESSQRFQREVQAVVYDIVRQALPRLPSSASAIYLDLLALEQEFGGLVIDDQLHELIVTTEGIALDGIYLGEFEIRLNWEKIGQSSQPYRVVAIDPHPAARRNDVTHPHVQAERLCEGDGRSAIAAALSQHRFYDFFVLVDQILHNYGAGSAYTELDNWDGMPCGDCGASVNDNDCYYCNGCESTLCDSCSPSCQTCESTYCSGCLDPCHTCGCDFCANCLEICPKCRKRFCAGCREEELCKDCYEKLQPEETEDESNEDFEEQEACLAGQVVIETVY